MLVRLVGVVTLSGCRVFLAPGVHLVSLFMIFFSVFGCVDLFLSLYGCCPIAQCGSGLHCVSFEISHLEGGLCRAGFPHLGGLAGAAMRCARCCFCFQPVDRREASVADLPFASVLLVPQYRVDLREGLGFVVVSFVHIN